MTRDEQGNIREVEPPKYERECETCGREFTTYGRDEYNCADCEDDACELAHRLEDAELATEEDDNAE